MYKNEFSFLFRTQFYIFEIVLTIMLCSNVSFSQKGNMLSNELENQHVFLLSNLENVKPNSPLFSNLKKLVNEQEGESTILFLGDIIDQNGVGKQAKLETLKLNSLLDLAEVADQIVFVPGDKEWDAGGKQGLKKVILLKRLQIFA